MYYVGIADRLLILIFVSSVCPLMCVVWSRYVVTLCCVRQPQSFLCVSIRWAYETSLSYHWA